MQFNKRCISHCSEGLVLLKRFDAASESELKKFDMKISNTDWFKFAQEKGCAE